MNANFFNQIAQLNITGVLQLNIAKGTEDNLDVSVILQNEGCGDTAKTLYHRLIFGDQPMNLTKDFPKETKCTITPYEINLGLNIFKCINSSTTDNFQIWEKGTEINLIHNIRCWIKKAIGFTYL